MNSAHKMIDWKSILVSGKRMFIGSNAAVPKALLEDLIANSQGFSDIELVHILTIGEPFWAAHKYRELFKINSLFLGDGLCRLYALLPL